MTNCTKMLGGNVFVVVRRTDHLFPDDPSRGYIEYYLGFTEPVARRQRGIIARTLWPKTELSEFGKKVSAILHECGVRSSVISKNYRREGEPPFPVYPYDMCAIALLSEVDFAQCDTDGDFRGLPVSRLRWDDLSSHRS